MKTLKEALSVSEALFSRKNLKSQNIFELSDDFRFEYVDNEKYFDLFMGNDEINVRLDHYQGYIFFTKIRSNKKIEIMDFIKNESIYYNGFNEFEIRGIDELTLINVKIKYTVLLELIKWLADWGFDRPTKK